MADSRDEWTTWLDEHGPALLAYAKQWASIHADAEDIVQEAFVRFWPARQTVRDPTAYLYVCVRRAAVDHYRKERRFAQCRQDATSEDERSGWVFQESSAESDERRLAIEEALMRLSDNQREVLVMKIWGGLTFPQIAEVTNVSVNTAASRYRYALASLRSSIAEEMIR